MKYSLFLSLIAFCVFASCQPSNNDGPAKKRAKSDKHVATVPGDDKVTTGTSDMEIRSNAGRDYTHKREEALAIRQHRLDKDNESYQMIVHGLFEYSMVHDGRKMSTPGDYEGQWIDFLEEHKYIYGYNKEESGSGVYHYDLESGKLLMIDDDPGINPQEYDLKRKAHVVILVGTTVYGNNNLQMKLMHRSTLEQVMDPNFKFEPSR